MPMFVPLRLCSTPPNVDLAGDYYDNGLVEFLVHHVGADRVIFGSDVNWIDPRANGHNVYISQIDYGLTDIEDDNPNTLPSGYGLEQNYPNPFNPSTSIEFSLPSKSHVKLEVYNLLGRKIASIADRFFESGTHTVNWDGKNFSGEQSASGIYFYRMEAGQFDLTRKMILLK